MLKDTIKKTNFVFNKWKSLPMNFYYLEYSIMFSNV